MGRYKGTRELSFLKEGYEEDFEDEMRLARRQKRKSVAEGESEPNSLMNATKKRRNDSTQLREEMLDKDYEEFLEYLAEHGDEGQDYLDTVWMDDGKAHSDEKLMDPEYKIFLENLRHDGKACVLEVLQENGKMVIIKYEHEDGILDGPNLDTPETLKESQVKEKTEIERNLRSDGMKRGRTFCLNNPVLPSNEEDIETPRTLRYAMKKQNRRHAEASEDLPKKKSEKVEAVDPVSDRPNGRSNKMRRLEVPNTPETFTNSPDLPKKKSSEVKKNVKVEAPDPVSDRPNGRSNKMRHFEVPSTPIYSPDLPKKKSSVVKKNVKVEAPDPVSNTPNGRSNKTEIKKTSGRFMKKENIKVGRPKISAHLLNKKVTETLRSPKYVIKENNWETQEDIPEKKSVMMKKKHANKKVADYYPKGRPVKRTHFSKCGRNHRAESDLMDDDYKMFLNGLNNVGGKKVYRSRSHDVVILEEDEESSSDVEIQEESSDRHFTSFTAVNRDSGRCIETDDTSHAQYRKGLMKDLKRPYDEEEYKKLLKEVSRRRLMGHARNLRHTIKCYSVAGELAPSYRERFVVLSRKIDQAKDDRPRILVLLRGFFYWLKTLAQEGSFTPWSDPECLKVLPQPDKKRKFNHN